MFGRGSACRQRQRPHPGGELEFSVTNVGSQETLIGVDYRLDRLEDNQWVQCNARQAFIAIGLWLRPGEQRKVVAAVPPTAPARRYRLTKSFGAGNEREAWSFEFAVTAG